MSHATTIVYGVDGRPLAYGIYSGTSDIQDPKLVESKEAAWSQEGGRGYGGQGGWDELEAHTTSCPDVLERVTVHSCYGGGMEWPGAICRRHMLIVEGWGDPHELMEHDRAHRVVHREYCKERGHRD